MSAAGPIVTSTALSVVGSLAESLRQQVQEKALRNGRQWAYDIVEAHARGEYRGHSYSLKLAQGVVEEFEALKKLRGGQ